MRDIGNKGKILRDGNGNVCYETLQLTPYWVRQTLSREKVLVTAKDHPASNALRIMAELVVGVAEASPKGFSNLSPAISTLMSTRSTGVKKFGSLGEASTYRPWRACGVIDNN